MMNYTYAMVDVKDEVFNILRAELPKHGFVDVKVLKSDPQTPAELPCVGINRISDEETNQTINDGVGTTYNKDTKEYTIIKGTFFSEAVEIRVWHTHADQRDILYRTVKAILFAYRQELVNKGLINISLRGGRDEQDTTMAHAPMVLYWGTITMSYLNPLNVEIVEIADIITDFTDVGGISNL